MKIEFSYNGQKISEEEIKAKEVERAKDGLNLRLGLFFPDFAPNKMIEGHKWHFYVEFYNAFMLLNMLVNGIDSSNESWCYERLLTNQSFK